MEEPGRLQSMGTMGEAISRETVRQKLLGINPDFASSHEDERDERIFTTHPRSTWILLESRERVY